MRQTIDESPEIIAFSERQIEQGRLQAILSYVIPFFLILPLRRRDNPFAFFHARQALTLWAAAVAAALALAMGLVFLMVLLMTIPISITIGLLAFAVFGVAAGLSLVGARNAWSGRGQVLPYVGRFGETHMTLLVRD